MSPEHQALFLKKLKVFVWEKHFIGAGGMEITDEVKVVIAATAVRLILHLDLDYYDRLTEIIVYPDHYRHPEQRDGYTMGEAHQWGTVVLSWRAVLHGLKNQHDGQDTATHEFAHVLDRGGGRFDGTPVLRSRGDYQPWAEVMSRHYLELKEYGPAQRKVLDMYGSINEAEFFAVASEAFFEKAKKMQEVLPDLYDTLKQFYGWDPAAPPQEAPEPSLISKPASPARIEKPTHPRPRSTNWKANTQSRPAPPSPTRTKRGRWNIDKGGCKG